MRETQLLGDEFAASLREQGAGGFEGCAGAGERIEVLLETPDTVAAWIREGRIQDGKTIASFHLWRAAQ